MGKKPQKLSSVLGNLLKAQGMESRLSEYRILGQWEETVGRVIASHARPVTVRGGKLFLNVDSPAWMQQLSMLKPEIIEKVNRGLGKAAIKGISLNLGEIPALGAPEERVVLRELTDEEHRTIEQYLGELRDADIKQSIRRVIEKDLRRKKGKQR